MILQYFSVQLGRSIDLLQIYSRSIGKYSQPVNCFIRFILFRFSVPVNSSGHVGMLSPFYGTSAQH